MKRRAFIASLTGGLLAAPLAAKAQPAGRLYKIGYLGGSSSVPAQPGIAAFRQHLRELGWVEGRNIAIEMRWAEGKADRLPTLATELVALGVDVIVTQGSPATRAAKQITTTVPIVMWNTTDPVGQGFVTSLARPGGNVTGLSDFSGELSSKRLELLREAIPNATKVAFLLEPDLRTCTVEWRNTEAAARRMAMLVYRTEVRGPGQIDGAFAKMAQERINAAIVPEGFIFSDNAARVLELAA